MNNWIIPGWPAPKNVKSIFTTRIGGVSNYNGFYDSLNLGDHVHDKPANVKRNRAILSQYLPENPRWLKQVHGTIAVWMHESVQIPEGDAALSCHQGIVCAVLVADCLPVFLCDAAGTTVGVVHAGWRGMAAGIIEQSVNQMRNNSSQGKFMAWLGPAIGPRHFVVGGEVREIFLKHDQESRHAFSRQNDNQDGKWLADIFLLARQRLANVGINEVYGGGICTFSDPIRFFSYRRDGKTGRMAALIWLE